MNTTAKTYILPACILLLMMLLVATGARAGDKVVYRLKWLRNVSVVGALYVRYSLSALAYQAIPSEIFVKYALTLLDNDGRVLIGSQTVRRQDSPDTERWFSWLDSSLSPQVYETALSRTDNSLVLHLEPYEAGGALADNALFLMVL